MIQLSSPLLTALVSWVFFIYVMFLNVKLYFFCKELDQVYATYPRNVVKIKEGTRIQTQRSLQTLTENLQSRVHIRESTNL
jgi:hypothetical protein